ncbi:MAG TPA: nuclear transport factor 2 family protein [Solirubrobacterales bacterium]|jgi:ketosteroid isomerase-like protein
MTTNGDRAQIARAAYVAFATGDRDAMEGLLARDYAFYSPPDPGLDRAGYFDRCWPHSGNQHRFEFVRVIESGDEVVVTYEATRVDGSRFRNTEVLTFDGDEIARTEVYFGWDLD